VARRKYWDLYENCEHLDPEIAPIVYEDQDSHSQRLMDACDFRALDITADDVRRSRRAYFANISYVDEKIGEVLEALRGTRQEDNTVIAFVSDHGDMLGERGLWFKMNAFEGSVRVPLMIAAPGLPAGRIDAPVSTMDLTPTLCDLAGISLDAIAKWTDGETLVPLANGTPRTSPVRIEYAAEGSVAPIICLRDGKYKYVACMADPAQLFDLSSDPQELVNLAADPVHAETRIRFAAMVARYWDLVAFDAEVRASQARRHVVYAALRNGAYYPWDFQPLQQASERYMRNHMDLNVLEESKRFPRGE
jgi:choline-sulfatase